MTQFRDTWPQVMSGAKTQTRRVVKPYEWAKHDFTKPGNPIVCIYQRGNRIKWAVGHTNAVQKGRGHAAMARYEILVLRREPLQAISEADAIAEGVLAMDWLDPAPPLQKFRQLWNQINNRPGDRWVDNPMVWVKVFELVEGTYA